jgi:uroporphyrinogen III methyltransferase/synthase
MPHSSNSVQPRSATESAQMPGNIGRVYLVGAGPGDPGLITVRGKRCLELAEVVLFDGLANPQLLEFAPQAQHICVGKHGSSPIWSQSAIHQKLIELARTGKTIVRLKGGDPAVFARTAEELEALAAARIPFEVVPGITAALAAASYVGIPITHRQHASAVAFITGQQQSRERPQPIDWASLARFPGTLVFYMGVTTVAQWTAKLIAAGKAADTPAAIVRRCSWSDQTVIRCSLSDVIATLTPSTKLRPPVIVIIGDVASLGTEWDWFSSRPLHGCGVLSTRPEAQSRGIAELLTDLGADVYHQPMLKITRPRDLSSLDQAIQLIASSAIQGITFSSANGVDGFMQRLFESGCDTRQLAGVRLAAVGPATARSLQQYGLRADVFPQSSDDYGASALIDRLGSVVRNTQWIVTTTNLSRDTLVQGLLAQGAHVTQALCYETQPTEKLSAAVETALINSRIQFCTITSSAIAESAYRLLGQHRDSVSPVSLSRSISETLERLGWPAVTEAPQRSSESLVEAIVAAVPKISRH